MQIPTTVRNFVIEVSAAPNAVIADETIGTDIALPEAMNLRSVVTLADNAAGPQPQETRQPPVYQPRSIRASPAATAKRRRPAKFASLPTNMAGHVIQKPMAGTNRQIFK